MTARRQRDIEAYRARIRELRDEQRRLAADQGEQLALPIPTRDVVVPITAARRRGWVKP